MKVLSKRAVFICGTALAGLALPNVASAQEEGASTEAVDSIIVTGTRIQRDGFDSPVPVTVVDSGLIEDLGQVNAAEIIRLIPQNVASQSDATAGAGLLPEAGASFANLRGLNPTYGARTLTLVNGRRFVPTSVGGQVDLNLIPSIMIGRVETVTGGASAAYGTDAVAGVVNIILDTNLDGFKGQIDYGQTGRGDGESFHGAAAWGTRIGDRGHFMIGGEYQKNEGIDHCAYSRDWCGEGWTVVENTNVLVPGVLNDASAGNPAAYANGSRSSWDAPGTPTFGDGRYIVGRNGGLVYNSIYGTVRNFARSTGVNPATYTGAYDAWYPAFAPPVEATDKVFTADGTGFMDFDPGRYAGYLVGGLALGGDNDSAYADQYIQTPVERYTTYAAANYDLTDGLNVYGELTYGKRMAHSRTLTAATRSTMVLYADNPYLPDGLATLLNGQPFAFGKDIDQDLSNILSVDAEAFRAVLGFKGDLFSDWTWDLYYQYGKNKRKSQVRYSRHNTALRMATDAIEDPNNPGNVICRPLDLDKFTSYTAEYKAELQALHANCVPVNLFGVGNLTPQAIDFSWHPVSETFEYRQHVVAGTVQGELYEGFGAGPLAAAAGFEYRNELGSIDNGGIDTTQYAFSFGLEYGGEIEVIEGFVEANLPIFADSALGDYLELNGAVRYSRNTATNTFTDQSKTVNAWSWKVGGIYDIVDQIRVRATQSRDIRAAGFRELFRRSADTEAGTSQGRVVNPATGATDPAAIGTGGSFLLRPEVADTTTAGLVLTPFRNFQLSADWYQIKLKDAIANLAGGQVIVDYCDQYKILCDRITYNGNQIVRVDSGQSNIAGLTVRGVDFEASYRLPLMDVFSSNAPGNLDFRFLLNYQYDFQVQPAPGGVAIEYAGQSGPMVDGGDFYPKPEWTWNGLVSYSTDRFNATVNVRHIGSGVLDATRTFVADPALQSNWDPNKVDSATYVNLAMSYEIPFGADESQSVEVFGAIDNLFDKDPPIAPGGGVSAGATAYPTNPVYFDTFGMRWRMGMRVKF